MFGSWSGTNTPGTGSFGNKGEQLPSYKDSFRNKTIAKGPNKGQNNGQNNGQKKPNNQQEEQSNFNPNNEGVFSIPIIKEFSNLNTQNIEIAEQEGMIGCSIC